MLANSDDGGPLEVFLVMCAAPIRWSTILMLENIQSTEDLYDKVNEHDEALIEAAKAEQGNILTKQNLASTLRRMCVQLDSSRGHNPQRPRRANLATIAEGEPETLEEGSPRIEEVDSTEDEVNDMSTIREVYNTFKK
ncbi:hypothetical protein C8R44DRAFT_863762 [Mycena epipterygia]|nr:hypothetical protein C8R44DRAFT_863762 [Mycena epipterygia]